MKVDTKKVPMDYYCNQCGSFFKVPELCCPNCNASGAISSVFGPDDIHGDSKIVFFCSSCGNYDYFDPGDEPNCCPICKNQYLKTTIPQEIWAQKDSSEKQRYIQAWLQRRAESATLLHEQNKILEQAEAPSLPQTPPPGVLYASPVKGAGSLPADTATAAIDTTISPEVSSRFDPSPVAHDFPLESTQSDFNSDHAFHAEKEYSASSFYSETVDKRSTETSGAETSLNEIPELDYSTLKPLLRRAFIFVEDREWDRAASYFEKILDEEPENPYAYLGIVFCEKHVSSLPELSTFSDSLKANQNYQRALQFADIELRKALRALA